MDGVSLETEGWWANSSTLGRKKAVRVCVWRKKKKKRGKLTERNSHWVSGKGRGRGVIKSPIRRQLCLLFQRKEKKIPQFGS